MFADAGTGANWRFDDAGTPLQITPSRALVINSSQALREAMLGGAGIALLPTFVVGDDIRAGRAVHILPASNPVGMFGSHVLAVYRENRFLPQKVRVFIDFVPEHFGEHPPEACGNCDNCLEAPGVHDATELSRKLLSAAYRTGQMFGVGHLEKVLTGSGDERIFKFGHDQLSVFGIVDAAAINCVDHQAVDDLPIQTLALVLRHRLHHVGACLQIAVRELVELGPSLWNVSSSLLHDGVEAS